MLSASRCSLQRYLQSPRHGKRPVCPLTEDRVEKLWYMRTRPHRRMESICGNRNGPRGYCTEWNKSDREGQIPCLTYMRNLKKKINEETKQKQTHTYRQQTGGRQRGGAWGWWERWRGKEVQISGYKINQGDVMHSTENTVNNTVVTLHGDRRLLDSRWHPKVYKCWVTVMHTWS